jgi:hypothetical protein
MSARFSSVVLALLIVPVVAGCSDQRVSYEISGSGHALTLIRVTGMPWQKTAKYDIVAARMPDCMRRHALGEAALKAPVDVYAPGNDAWILKQGSRMFVVETRSCEGFAKLDAVPDDGLGPLVGRFEMQSDTLVFSAAPKAEPAIKN